jgi:CRP/FNR family transcriptional regulator, cyclic AMP receptor protein
VLVLLNSLYNSRLSGLHGADKLQLIASGLCLGVGFKGKKVSRGGASEPDPQASTFKSRTHPQSVYFRCISTEGKLIRTKATDCSQCPVDYIVYFANSGYTSFSKPVEQEPERGTSLVEHQARPGFDLRAYLASPGTGRRIVHFEPKETLFAQGAVADFVLYLESGRVRLTVVSNAGKEATVTHLTERDFIGEEAVAGINMVRTSRAVAITACLALKIERFEVLRVLRTELTFSNLFLKFMVSRSLRTQADLIDQLFNSSEKRLARALILMAEFGKVDEPHTLVPLIPKVTQETLAEMIGTTRSRVSFFMNRFRRLGYIEYHSYNGRIHVNKSLLNVLLHDRLPEQNASTPTLDTDSPATHRKVGRPKTVRTA